MMDLIKVKDLIETQGLFICPHCWGSNKIMVFATLIDLRTHIRKGCVIYRFRTSGWVILGHCICFCTECRVMLCDPDSIELEDMSIEELQQAKELDYDIEDVHGDLFFSKCPVCKCITVMFRYECHSGGAGA